jgi:hypothetical protein
MLMRPLKYALLTFLAARTVITAWGVLVPLLSSLPTAPEPALRPYLGQPHLDSGLTGLLLNPWQHFDTQCYAHY